MNRLDRISVKWRIFSYLMLFIAIPLTIIWCFQLIFMEGFYTRIKTQEVLNSAETVATNMSVEGVSFLIDSIARRNDVMVGVYKSDGTAIYVAGRMPTEQDAAFLNAEHIREYYARAVENGGKDIIISKLSDETNLENTAFEGELPASERREVETIACSIIVPAANNRTEDLMIMVNAEITPVDSTVRTTKIQLLYMTLIMIVLSLLIALVMSDKISGPIIKINKSAKELAKGEYDTVFDAHGYREIAELNRTLNYAASELSKVEKLRQELIANVSHDLRTPLTMITGYAEMMRDIPGENTPENVQTIIEEASRLSLLVTDVLDLSLLQCNEQKPEKVRFNLTECVRDIIKRCAKLTTKQEYSIEFLADRDVFVEADRGKISQVVYNLITNAINYTGEDKRVMVTQAARDGKVKVEVQDTGAGISGEELPYIWDRYYRAEENHVRATGGSGLGLSIVRSILKLHDAAYGATSVVGEGTAFWFELEESV